MQFDPVNAGSIGSIVAGYQSGRSAAGTTANALSRKGYKTKNEELARNVSKITSVAGAVGGLALGFKNKNKLLSLAQKYISNHPDMHPIFTGLIPFATGVGGAVGAGALTGAATSLRGAFKRSEKTASSNPKEVSIIAVKKGNLFLMGKRRDNNLFSQPGGHLDKNEAPLDGAKRELEEETGIIADKKDLHFKVSKRVSDEYLIHLFEYQMKPTDKTKSTDDPDAEVYRWFFTNPLTNKELVSNLHTPKNNVLFDYYDIPYGASAMKRSAFLKGFEKSALEILKGGKGGNRPDSNFDPKDLKEGMKVESEHTPIKAVQKEITKDHLTEKKNYYKLLEKHVEKAASFWASVKSVNS